jgi:hypothetical protein
VLTAPLLCTTSPSNPHLLSPSAWCNGATADAGADLGPWSSDPTEYDFVQVAANNKDTDAALKLVEAGAKWQLPKDQHTMGGTIYYPPEILVVNLPNLKVCSHRLVAIF